MEADTHKCFIQVAKSPQEQKEDKKKNNKKRKRGASLATLEANSEGMDLDDDEDKLPLHVFFDIKVMQDTSHHMANLIAETKDDNCAERFRGYNYVKHFLEWLHTRPVTVTAHNFQGYDGYFIAEEYHKQQRQIEEMRNGGKLMQVTHDKIRFIDLLSFFQMPLPFLKPLVSKSSRKVISRICSIPLRIKIIKDLSQTSNTTCRKPCQ